MFTVSLLVKKAIFEFENGLFLLLLFPLITYKKVMIVIDDQKNML